MENKRCARCKATKPHSDFHRQSRLKEGLQAYCKECTAANARDYYADPEKRPERLAKKREQYAARGTAPLEYAKAFRAQNPERVALNSRRHMIKKKYGLTLDQYDEMVQRQSGLCALCRRPPLRTNLAVDHDHSTGAIRMLLCDLCNQGLGCLKDDPELLRRAAEYIEKFRT